MNKLLAVCAIIALSGCKCKKTTPAPAPFMPTTAGSTWNYNTRSYAPIPGTGSYVLTATSKDTVINTRTYRVFTNSNTGSEYYNQTGTDYYQFGDLAALNQRLELLYLKDVAAGTSWTDTKTITLTGIPAPVSIPVNYQVTEAGISYVANGKTYTDVIHVKVTFGTISVSGFPITPVTDLNFYYARGVGRIYSRSKVAISVPLAGININTDDEVTLVSYTIK